MSLTIGLLAILSLIILYLLTLITINVLQIDNMGMTVACDFWLYVILWGMMLFVSGRWWSLTSIPVAGCLFLSVFTVFGCGLAITAIVPVRD